MKQYTTMNPSKIFFEVLNVSDAYFLGWRCVTFLSTLKELIRLTNVPCISEISLQPLCGNHLKALAKQV